MRQSLIFFSLILILCVTGCAINPPVSGSQALQRDPDEAVKTGTTNADRP